MLIDPVVPPSLGLGLTRPLGDPLGASKTMLPDYWREVSDPIDVPSIWLLRNAHVFGGNITKRRPEGYEWGQLLLTSTGDMLPASFGVMDGNRETSASLISRLDGTMRLREIPEARVLKGSYYFLGNVHRHFGHNIVEGVTRAWAIPFLDAASLDNVKFIVYEDTLSTYSWDLLRLAGVRREQVVHASRHDVVERLIVPDIAMRTHRWITKFQHEIWRGMADNVSGERPWRRVLLSRKNISERPLENQEAVELMLRDHGYEVVCPETLDVEDQIRLASESISLAGCVGSQMYLAAFQADRGTNLVLAPRNFYLKDDLLISQASGSHLEVVLGSKIDFSKEKTERTWNVNLPSVEAALANVKSQIDARFIGL
jgi:capsular polysaccharide biosynthesis protein